MDVSTERRRSRQVNRAFHDVILASPLIQHKIDLFTTGLEYNAASGTDLAESRQALHQYRRNLNALCPVEEITVENIRIPDDDDDLQAVGGVYAIVEGTSSDVHYGISLTRDTVQAVGDTASRRGGKLWLLP